MKADVFVSTKTEDNTIKSEPAIIPTTGKAKRKLSQKNSLTERENSVDEDSEKERVRERQKKKDILFERHRLKSRERKTEKELKLLEDKGKKEKHSQQKEIDLKKSTGSKKQQCKVIQVPAQEEEASSTTTESSNSSTNCDEVDKENQRLSWPKQKVHVSSQTVNEARQEAQDSKIKHVSFVNSKLRNKGGTKSPSPPEQDKDQEGDSKDKGDDAKAPLGHNNNTNR